MRRLVDVSGRWESECQATAGTGPNDAKAERSKMDGTDDNVTTGFLEKIVKELCDSGLAQAPNTLEVDADSAILEVPPRTPSGFHVKAQFERNSYTLFAEGWHQVFEAGPISEAQGRILKLTGGGARLHEFRAGGSPYKWELFTLGPTGEWSSQGTIGLVFYNYFAKKARVEKVNDQVIFDIQGTK